MDRLRSALLNSISHDLRTPLTVIRASAEALRNRGGAESANGKADLIENIVEESERLNRFIANLLDMTKLESGAIRPSLALHHPRDVVDVALGLAKRVLVRHRVKVELDADLPLVSVDALLLEQAIFNVLDNAAKYAPADTTILIQGALEGKTIYLRISDEGSGIPPAELEHIFEKFYRLQKGDLGPAGTGLGLAIARGFVEALQGKITATNRDDRPGAVFTIALPAAEFVDQDEAPL
jgi:two-component system, OmpR family, sensor histidine kinase KdpD